MSNNFSYSKVSTYESCPFKYYLNYELGNYAFTGSIATEFGTAVHETEEKIAQAIQKNEVIDYVGLKNNFIKRMLLLEDKYKNEFFECDKKSNRSYKDKKYEYLTSGIYRLEKLMLAHPTYEIVGIEQKFNFKYDENHFFNGAIDRVLFDKATNKYIIQDIKTYAVPIEQKDLATPLQFVVYTLAAKELFSCSEADISCQYELPLVNISQSCCTKGYMKRGLAKLNSLFTGIFNKEFSPKPTCLCNYCNFCRTNPEAVLPYKNLCPYYCLWNRDTRNKQDISKVENEWQGLESHAIILEAFNKKYELIC